MNEWRDLSDDELEARLKTRTHLWTGDERELVERRDEKSAGEIIDELLGEGGDR